VAEEPLHLYELTLPELETHLARDGVNPVHAAELWRSLYRLASTADGTLNQERWTPPLRRWWEARSQAGLILDELEECRRVESTEGDARKLLFRLTSGHEIETVLMGYPGRYTACVSSQAGCAMGCVFCATGQMGFDRHLRAGEIVTQVLQARRLAAGMNRNEALRNLVLMGMGEPLHNYDAVMKALGIVCDQRGIGLGPGRITISTVGVVPGIRRMADERQPYHLAVSLHAATDEERSKLVPVNRRWPLPDILDACRYYSKQTGRRVLFGWTLIAGENDSPDHAAKVADLLRGLDAHINLIRLNPTAGFNGTAADDEAAIQFREVIQAGGFPCTIRQRKGLDVAAGCGQLKAGEAG